MAPCGRVRSRCPGPALLLLLALAARPVVPSPAAGIAGAGGAQAGVGQPAGPGAAAPRSARGGGSGSGWKLSEEAVCREDVVRLCSKHSWANNLAVLECLQDVREVRVGPGAGPGLPAAANKERGPRPAASPPRISLMVCVLKIGVWAAELREASELSAGWPRGLRRAAASHLHLGAPRCRPRSALRAGRALGGWMALCSGSAALRGYSFLEVWESPARVVLSEGAVLVAAVT